MNIKKLFDNSQVYLEMAKEKLDREDYIGARDMLAKSYSLNRALLEHVATLVVDKANVDLSAAEEDPT